MAEKARRMKKNYDEDAGTCSFTFENLGETLTLSMSDLSEDIQRKLMYHGAIQKIGDGGAVGKDATDQDCYNGVKSVIDQLLAGEWTTKRAALDTDSKRALDWLKVHAEDDYNRLMALEGDAKREAITKWTDSYNTAIAKEVKKIGI